MKLIDLLVQELPKRGGWPDGVDAVEQDSDGQLFEMESDYCSDFKLKKCDDWIADVVTKQQYESALTESQKPAWSGEGVPPVGCECECYLDDGIIHCIVVGYDFDGKAVVMRNVPARKYFSIQANSGRIKPMRTEAERKRNDAAKEMARHANTDEHRKFNAGLRNCLSIYDAIAAGKIPGVKLED